MPEGHTIRHLATVHEKAFSGKKVVAYSPQGRFAVGSRHVDGQVMTHASAHGKHLFLHFGKPIVHVHLGLYGWFTLKKVGEGLPSHTTRLRLQNDEYTSDLIGPTKCELVTQEQMNLIISKLGPDPIHEDADAELVWNNVVKSKKSIASLLMNQSVVAGIGNVYRAELLFRSQLNPTTPGFMMNRDKFDEIWQDARALLRIGAVDGRIKTVNPQYLTNEEKAVGGHAQFSYVYKRTGFPCRICFTEIEQSTVDGRKLYWCPKCQM
jgi:endonuclease VIII